MADVRVPQLKLFFPRRETLSTVRAARNHLFRQLGEYHECHSNGIFGR